MLSVFINVFFRLLLLGDSHVFQINMWLYKHTIWKVISNKHGNPTVLLIMLPNILCEKKNVKIFWSNSLSSNKNLRLSYHVFLIQKNIDQNHIHIYDTAIVCVKNNFLTKDTCIDI